MKIAILGAGIAGLSTATVLEKLGFEYSIYESTKSMEPVGAGLGLGANAIKAMKHLGIADEVIASGKELESFDILDQKGRLITKTDTQRLNQQFGLNNFTIHRARLHEVLLKHIDVQKLHLNKRCTSMKSHGNGLELCFEDGSVDHSDYLIVADGIHSNVRKQLVPASQPRYSGYTCWRGVLNYPTKGLQSSESWGKEGRFGIVPLDDNLLYWFACVNARQNDQSLKAYGAGEIGKLFQSFHEPIPSIIAATQNQEIIWGDIFDLKPLARYAFGKVLLIGDAAHATTPNMGQGACQALEDAAWLKTLLSNAQDLEEVFRRFERIRLKRTHWVTQQSRSIGKLAQLSNPFLVGLRNGLFRLIPERVNEKQLKRLYNVSFSS